MTVLTLRVLGFEKPTQQVQEQNGEHKSPSQLEFPTSAA